MSALFAVSEATLRVCVASMIILFPAMYSKDEPAGIGISLGNNCIVEAGLYVTSGTKVHIMDAENKASKVVKQLKRDPNLKKKLDSLEKDLKSIKKYRKDNPEVDKVLTRIGFFH